MSTTTGIQGARNESTYSSNRSQGVELLLAPQVKPCLGVLCPLHSSCQCYAAVDGYSGGAIIWGTCQTGTEFPDYVPQRHQVTETERSEHYEAHQNSNAV